MAEAGNDDQTNLIINYLPQTLTDGEFRIMFQSIGPLKTAKVVRDKATGYSYGFGFVNYQNQADAERAIKTLNGLQLQNKHIKVALARPSGDTIKGANLYIRNIPKSMKDDELLELFTQYGCIIQCRILYDTTTGMSKGVGFVLFDKKEEADRALEEMNGFVPPMSEVGIQIKFADDNTKKVRPPAVHVIPGPRFPMPPGPMRNQGNRFRYNPMSGANSNMNQNSSSSAQGGYILFCYNIGYDANERTLWQLFSPFGTVQKVNVIYDHQKNQCKGYGFVTMTNFQEAQNCINCLNGYYYNGRALSVSFKK